MKISSTKNAGVDRLKIFVYGQSGVGKTYLARTAPHNKTLVISAEAGLLCLKNFDIDVLDISKNDKGELIPKEKRIARLGEVFNYLNTKEAQEKYEWIFIDSLTEISQNLSELLLLEFPERKDALPMWGEYTKKLTALIKGFRDLPNYHVVMTALSETKAQDAGRFQFVSVNGKISQKIPQFFDEVFYMELHTDDKGAKKGIFKTTKTDQHFGKDRDGALSAIEEADLTKILNKIRENNKPQTVAAKPAA